MPHNGEQEYCQGRGSRIGHHHLHKGLPGPAAVYLRRLLQLPGHIPEKLPVDIDEQSGPHAHSQEGGQVKGQIAVEQVRGIRRIFLSRNQRQQAAYSEEVKIPVLHHQRKEYQLGGNHYGHNHHGEKRPPQFKTESCKSISHNSAHHHLYHRAGETQHRAPPKGGPEVKPDHRRLDIGHGQRLGDPNDAGIRILLHRHERLGKNLQQRIDNHETDDEEQQEPHHRPCQLRRLYGFLIFILYRLYHGLPLIPVPHPPIPRSRPRDGIP